MEMEFLWKLLSLLFGQVGVLGTILIAMCTYLAWDVKEERASHRATREYIYELQEKRVQMHTANLEAMTEIKVSLDQLTRTILGWRKR